MFYGDRFIAEFRRGPYNNTRAILKQDCPIVWFFVTPELEHIKILTESHEWPFPNIKQHKYVWQRKSVDDVGMYLYQGIL